MPATLPPRHKAGKTSQKGPKVKKPKLQMKREDWRGLIAVLVILSFVFVLTITIVITHDKEFVSLIAAIFSGVVSAVVTGYFTAKARK